MKKLLFIVSLLFICFTSFAQVKRVNYNDIDIYLQLSRRELAQYCRDNKICYTDMSKGLSFITIGDGSYTIDVYYDMNGGTRRIEINNPPYNTSGMWPICVIDNKSQLCYVWRDYTYKVYVTKNQIVLTDR